MRPERKRFDMLKCLTAFTIGLAMGLGFIVLAWIVLIVVVEALSGQ